MPTKDGNHAYTDEERAEIIAHVLVNVACGRFVSRIFREDDMTENGILLPAEKTFWYWILVDDAANDGELGKKLAQARTHGIEALLDEVPLIADTPVMGEEVSIERDPELEEDRKRGSVTDLNGNPVDGTIVKVKRSDMIAHRKLQIETRIKIAQMMNPKKYGPKVDVTSGGEKIGAADAVQEARLRVKKLRDEERGVE
jgi:hypothetical protein